MPKPRRASKRGAAFALMLVLALLVTGTVLGVAGLAKSSLPPEERAPLGYFGTLPIYWGDSVTLGDMLATASEPHWVRAELERRYALRPLDILGEGEAGDTLVGLENLLIAQPRALSSTENVALDAWVRAGGHLLLFADPMLTAESPYPLGDKRRPHDVVLLSPILTHWGLRLEYDDFQQQGERIVEVDENLTLPVNLPGRLAVATSLADKSVVAPCRLSGQGLVALCRIGKGQALIVADAALLEDAGEGVTLQRAALAQLARQAFSAN
ncbi:MAG: ABC transporter [Novosphingobium sp.]